MVHAISWTDLKATPCGRCWGCDKSISVSNLGERLHIDSSIPGSAATYPFAALTDSDLQSMQFAYVCGSASIRRFDVLIIFCFLRRNLRKLVDNTSAETEKNIPRSFWRWLKGQPWRRMLPDPHVCLVLERLMWNPQAWIQILVKISGLISGWMWWCWICPGRTQTTLASGICFCQLMCVLYAFITCIWHCTWYSFLKHVLWSFLIDMVSDLDHPSSMAVGSVPEAFGHVSLWLQSLQG